MRERKRSLTFFLMALFIIGSLPINNSVSAEDEVDNWPENDAWLHIELISWSANETVEWDNNGGLPDPIFKVCIEADGDNLDCINTPTWENQMTLNNSWNYSLDIPDHSNILNITIECEDNDALNDDECDMNSELDEWKLYAEYNWSATPTLTVSGNGDGDGNDTWKNAASTWKLTIDGYGDEDGDGVSDNVDLCQETSSDANLLNHTFFAGCGWNQLDFDIDGIINKFDQNPYNADYSVANTSASFEEWAAVSSVPIPTTSSQDCNSEYNCWPGIGKFLLMEFNEELGIRNLPNFYSNGQAFVENICSTDGSCDWYAQGSHNTPYPYYITDIDYNGIPDFIGGNTFLQGSIENGNLILTDNDNLWECRGIDSKNTFWVPADLDNDGLIEVIAVAFTGTQYSKICSTSPNSSAEHISLIEADFSCNVNQLNNFDIMREEITGLHVIKCGNDVFWLNGDWNQNPDNIINIIEMNFSIDINSNSVAMLGGDFADLNNDGFVDLLLGNGASAPSQFNCEIYFGGVSGFSDGFLIDSLEWNSGDDDSNRKACEGEIEVLDLDGDGDLDIASKFCYTENTGDAFVPYCGADTSDGNYHSNFQFYDVDGDGDLDRITASSTSFQVFLNPAFIDIDQDGIDDTEDLCPYTQSDEIVNSVGCSESELDSDSDGVFNDVDLCQNTNQNMVVNEDGCSDEQLDDDGDGLNNALDECPDTPPSESVNFRGCSFEESQDLDSDNDGVLDSADACPNTPADVTVDSIGCDLEGNQIADTDSDGDGVYDSQDECANTPVGATGNFKGCPMDSDYDGVYDGIDECPSSNNPAPSDMAKSSEVDSTGCFIYAAGSESDSGSAAFGCLGMIVMIGMVVFVIRKVRSPKQEQVFYAQTQPVMPVQQQYVPTPQVSSRERELEHQSRQAQIEAQRLRQQLANQAQITQQLQSEATQKQMSDAALAQKQHELAIAQQEKEELEAKLAEAEKNTPIVQNITYNIQDSAISGDITNKINRNDLE